MISDVVSEIQLSQASFIMNSDSMFERIFMKDSKYAGQERIVMGYMKKMMKRNLIDFFEEFLIGSDNKCQKVSVWVYGFSDYFESNITQGLQACSYQAVDMYSNKEYLRMKGFAY